MKRSGLLTLACFAITLVHAFGESDAARELKRLREEQQKAIAAATAPINQRYRASLEQLLRRAQATDLDTAITIKKEIQTLGELRQWIAEGTWGWYFADDEKGKKYGNLKFKAGGKLESDGEITFLNRWEMAGPNKFKVFADDNGYWTFEYDATAKEARSVKQESSKEGLKILRLNSQ